MRMLYSHIDGQVLGNQRAVSLVKGQPVDVDQVVGKTEPSDDSLARPVTLAQELGPLLDGFTAHAPIEVVANPGIDVLESALTDTADAAGESHA